MLEILSKFSVPYKDFLRYLYINVFKKDKKAFDTKVRKLPDNILVIRAFEFLEKEYSVPILEALCYYSYRLDNYTFSNLCRYMIKMEFQRIYLGKTCNYIPF